MCAWCPLHYAPAEICWEKSKSFSLFSHDYVIGSRDGKGGVSFSYLLELPQQPDAFP